MRTVNLFAYGTLKRGEANHELIKRELEAGLADYLGQTVAEGFDLYRSGDVPVAVPGTGQIKGESFRIPRDLLTGAIDRLEGFPHGFDRKQIDVDNSPHWIYYYDRVPPGAIPVEHNEWSSQKEK